MSCADVCLSNWDAESPDFWSEKWVTARKVHTCVECRTPVLPGTKYMRHSGKSGGSMYTGATCAVCIEVRTAFVCGGFLYGELWEMVRDGMFPVWRTKGAWDCLAKLTSPEATAKCNAEYREWLADNDHEDVALEAPEV